MKPVSIPIALPPVRKRVFRHSLWIVALYVFVGIYMTVAVFLASSLTPKAIHQNYDSISAGHRMIQAWNAIKNPAQHPDRQQDLWLRQFEEALAFEETNITEPGEARLAAAIRTLWNESRTHPLAIENRGFAEMERLLGRLISLNEAGMFGWAAESLRLRQRVLFATVLIFLLTVAIALYLADGLAVLIATPLRDLSAALKRKPDPGSRLRLPEPTTLEMRILSSELLNLWERVTTLQKLNVEELSSQRKQLQTVLTSVEDAILVLDNEDRVVHCNQGILRLLGAVPELVTGQLWRDLSLVSPNYLRLREALTPEISSELPLEFQLDGENRVFSGRSRVILDESQARTGMLYLLHDITAIRQKDRLKSEFIGVLSHELKTPLQSLGTASELLLQRKDLLDEDGRMLIETIHEDVGRIKGVANEFIQVGLVELHSLRLKIETLAINAFLPQWIQPFQVLARDRNIRIEFIHEGSKNIYVKIDPVKFPWAITNLLSNSVRVSPSGAAVTVHLTDRDGMADIEVRDEGPGIPEADQNRIFDPYYQGTQAGLDKTGGFLGLGLTITREVVEAHEGNIGFYPRKPSGSIFRIRLPLVIGSDARGK